ncbi:PREDICTED: NXPE family member 3-like [Branchiostoma belcheri]|uniref:NXPE family member 3-like n=1 Tax=Branchiostoma belcheri TaxID=7741 RepID=A0A6P4XT62_BRABE|nr:PREDICTED: NXPE family member 3-like [Branchiostoma belcheri]
MLSLHPQNSFTLSVLCRCYQIKIQLVHPSEAVKVLERVRELPNKRVFHCSFVDAKTTKKKKTKKKASYTSQCFSSANPRLSPHQQCDFSKPDVNGTWICEKPDKLPCSAISKCKYNLDKSRAKMLKLVSEGEKKLFQKPYLEEELEVDPKEPIHVLKAELPTPQHLPACTWDKSAALGHWSGKVWTSSVCNVRVFTQNDIRRCLANKTVYMQARLEGDNSQWNISLRYRYHHFPVQGRAWCVFCDFRYVVETLDSIPGGPNTIIVLSLWAHFTAEPLELLRSRLYAIRAAIHRLKRRAPGTRVFVRTGTTREHKGGKLEFYLLGSDWLAYQITEVIREMFRADPDVVVLDTWDMSVCQPGKDNVHPDQTMVDSQLNRLLSHICIKKKNAEYASIRTCFLHDLKCLHDFKCACVCIFANMQRMLYHPQYNMGYTKCHLYMFIFTPHRPYLEEELEVDPKEPIHVLEAELPTPQHLPACTWDKSAALGHWSGKVWTSSVCNVRVFTQNDIRRCLANKTVYMQGDSTIRQWGQRLLTVVPLNHKKTNIARLEGDNSQWNISVRYRFHHFPVQGRVWCVFYDFRYVVETLDTNPGGPNTVIILSLWAHFTAEPLELLRSRLYAIRAAIHRLKRRAPGTRVFVRTGTTREHKGGKLEFYLLGSDWLAYQITEVIREMFRADPDVVVLDTWDMSVCQPGKDNVHPDQTMVDSQLNRLLSHICPN